jgi:hypothetical protein
VLDIAYPVPDERVDSTIWEWKTLGDWSIRRTIPNTPSYISSSFYQTCKLMVLATKVMNAMYAIICTNVYILTRVDSWKLPKNAGSESTASLA